MTELIAKDEAQQVALGAALSRAVGTRALIFLQGDLGAGKTTLVRGFLQARGHQGAVKSPTYTLIEPYVLPGGQCYHLDLYRVGDGEELEYLGLREMLDEQAVLLIEWPQRGAGWLPLPDLTVSIEHLAAGRRLRLEAASDAGRRSLAALNTNLFD
jgi:tRNA threonylcarbamoyladenosine biosynthesis protein TsaE